MRSLLLIATFATGCMVENGGGSNPTGGGGGGGGGGPVGSGSASMIPTDGAWHYVALTPVSNTCGPQLDPGAPSDFGIDGASTTGFHVLPDDGTPSFDCHLSGASFDCPVRAAGTKSAAGIDAIVTYHAHAAGSFSAIDRGTGSQDMTVSCTGSDCSSIASFPCELSVSFTIAAL